MCKNFQFWLYLKVFGATDLIYDSKNSSSLPFGKRGFWLTFRFGEAISKCHQLAVLPHVYFQTDFKLLKISLVKSPLYGSRRDVASKRIFVLWLQLSFVTREMKWAKTVVDCLCKLTSPFRWSTLRELYSKSSAIFAIFFLHFYIRAMVFISKEFVTFEWI